MKRADDPQKAAALFDSRYTSEDEMFTKFEAIIKDGCFDPSFNPVNLKAIHMKWNYYNKADMISYACYIADIVKKQNYPVDEKEKYPVGTLVQHFKRELLKEEEKKKKKYVYRILAYATHTETEESYVVYQAMYDDQQIWVRPYDMFYSKVDKKKFPDIKQETCFTAYQNLS